MQASQTQGMRKNQLRNGTSGVCCHAPTLVISLLALQTCIALACTTPAPAQRCLPARVRSWKEVTAGVGRSDNYRSHNQEHLHADHNDCQRTHLRDEAMEIHQTPLGLRAERSDCLIDSDNSYTPCQIFHSSSTCISTEILQYHRPYYGDTNLTLGLCPAGTSFLRCHQSSNSHLNTALHDTSRVPDRSQPCTLGMRDKWDKGEKIKTKQSKAAPQRAVTPSNSLTEEHNLPLLQGLEYSQKQISGDSMANSLNDSLSWTQRLVFKGLAITTMGAQCSADGCRKYFVDIANRSMPNLGMQLAERRFYHNSNKGVQGFCAKPTTNPAATANFLAA